MSTRRVFVLVPAIMLAALAVISCSQNPAASPHAATSAPSTSSATKAAAVNAAGTWTWTYDGGGNGQAITHTYTLKQNGETLTGTFKDTFDETTVEIKDGKIHDDQVSFSVARPFGDNGTMNFTFTGKIEGNTIKGKANWTVLDQPTTADWLAKRGS